MSTGGLNRCFACGYGVDPALGTCPECGEPTGQQPSGWKQKLFGGSRPAVSSHRGIEARATDISRRVESDLDRMDRQRAELRSRLRDPSSATRDQRALQEALRLLDDAVASRHRLRGQCLIALADIALARAANLLDRWTLGDSLLTESTPTAHWRRLVWDSALPCEVPCTALSVCDRRRLAAVGRDGSLHVWDLDTATPVFHASPDPQSRALSVTCDGNYLLAGNASGDIHMWPASSWSTRSLVGKHPGGVRAIAAAPDASWVATAGKDAVIRVWSLADRQLAFTLTGHEDAVLSLAVTRDGSWLASGSWDGVLKLWNLRTRAEQGSIRGHEGGILALAFHPDGTRLASAGWDKTVRVWPFRTRLSPISMTEHSLAVFALAFSEDGRWLASGGGDRVVRIWDTKEFACAAVLPGDGEPVLGVAFCGANELWACGGPSGVRLHRAVLPPLTLFSSTATISSLASDGDVMGCSGGAEVVLRAHRHASRIMDEAMARLAHVAADRARKNLDAPPSIADLRDAGERLCSDLVTLAVDPAARESRAWDIERASAQLKDLAGHCAFAAAAAIVTEAESQIAGLEHADDESCARRLERLRTNEHRVGLWRKWLSGQADTGAATGQSIASLDGLHETIPSLIDMVLARRATALVAGVNPIAEERTMAGLRRVRASMSRIEPGREAGNIPSEDDGRAAADATRALVLSELERRYREISSQNDTVVEIDGLTRGSERGD